MKQLTALIAVLLLANFSTIAQRKPSRKAGVNSFILKNAAKTTAGVYKEDGTLVRTLWSGVYKTAGTHEVDWDGTDDFGEQLPIDDYTIRVTSNNIKATWEGIIGNTSSTFEVGNSAENSVYHPYLFPYDMSIIGSEVYLCSDYNETQGSIYKFNTNDPGTKILVTPPGYSQITTRLANDGSRLYMGGSFAPESSGPSITYIQAATFANLNNFSAYLPFQGIVISQFGFKVCDTVRSDSRITGLAVESSGNYMFVARELDNSIHVVNKISGIVAQRITVTAPTMMAIDAAGSLWMSHNHGTVEKFTINSNGTLTTTGVSIAGFASIQGLSCNGTTVAVANAPVETAQQIKGYSTANGSLLWTLGQNASYSTDATVQNDKFCFKDRRTTVEGYPNSDQYASIAFEPDGSLWVNDRNNSRLQHFNSSRVYDKQLAFLEHSRKCGVDPNNPTRLFSHYLEYDIDYTKPLIAGNSNGAWRLAKNWSYNVIEAKGGTPLNYVTTLSNGRTYCLENHGSGNQYEFAELVSGGTLRYTGVTVPMFDNYQLCKDGSVIGYNARNVGGGHTWYWSKATITGFDGSNNPILSSYSDIASIVEDGNNVVPIGTGRNAPASITSGNIIPVFRNDIGNTYHLAGLPVGATQPLWQTAKPVTTTLADPFPNNGDYDIYPGTQYAGNTALASDSLIFWGYNGEFWHGNGHQTNFWNVVSEKGLFLTQFGTSNYRKEMAGNAFSAAVAKLNNVLYLYLNDESVHGGIHRWKITGLNTIEEQTIQINSSPLNAPISKNYRKP